jgi:2-C-methyl-D-erythritol 4-phosphate cytidylyltransferase
MKPDVAVIIPAAGTGRRLGGMAKPFVELGGEPILRRTLRPFLDEPRVGWIVIALPTAIVVDPPHWLTSLDPRIALVRGGTERMHSVRLALDAVPDEAAVVLVHDAARPLVSSDLIRRAIVAAAAGRCVIAAVPATDTIQRVDTEGRIIETPDRSELWLAQTPQAFPRSCLAAAADNAVRTGFLATDDAALVIRAGGTVHVIGGERDNIKVTEPADLILAEALLRQRAAE